MAERAHGPLRTGVGEGDAFHSGGERGGEKELETLGRTAGAGDGRSAGLGGREGAGLRAE